MKKRWYRNLPAPEKTERFCALAAAAADASPPLALRLNRSAMTISKRE